MHTGQPNPQSITNEYISGKIVLDDYNKFIYPALNVSNNFATIGYEAQMKMDYTSNHVFRSMTTRIKYSSYSL